MLLIPSMLTDSMAGLLPATERLPLLSINTPGCVVSVVMALVDPLAREAIATGKSTSSLPVLVSARLETSVFKTAAVSSTLMA